MNNKATFWQEKEYTKMCCEYNSGRHNAITYSLTYILIYLLTDM